MKLVVERVGDEFKECSVVGPGEEEVLDISIEDNGGLIKGELETLLGEVVIEFVLCRDVVEAGEYDPFAVLKFDTFSPLPVTPFSLFDNKPVLKLGLLPVLLVTPENWALLESKLVDPAPVLWPVDQAEGEAGGLEPNTEEVGVVEFLLE